MSVLTRGVPHDWYLQAFDLGRVEAPPDEVVDAEVDLAVELLQARPGERILDLACGMGRHSKELARRGFQTFGVDIDSDLIEIADGEAHNQRIPGAAYERADLRDLELDPEFDAVLSLHSGAIGYFASAVENHRTFEVVADALRPGGRHLAQLPNVRHAEERLPAKDWRIGTTVVDLVEQRWNPETRCLEGELTAIHEDSYDFLQPTVPFRQRLYTVEELRGLYTSVSMKLVAVFDPRGNLDERGEQADPSPADEEIFVLAERS